MTKHVILNLAEETGAGTGVTAKVKDAVLAHGKQTRTSGAWFWKSTRIIQTNEVEKFDLVETFDRTSAGTFGFSREKINELRLACTGADTVYLCAHGSATDRNQVFTQRGEVGSSRVVMLATVTEFTDFARLVLSQDKVHDLRLIVCFAARSSDADQTHTRTFLASDRRGHQALKSSLAYKLYDRLHSNGVSSTMYARLGEVRVSATADFEMEILTQSEAGVIAGLGVKTASQREQALGTAITDLRKAELRTFISMNLEDLGPKNKAETDWVAAYRDFVRLNQEKEQQAQLTGKGRLCYETASGQLVISFEGDEIYRGAFF